MNGLLIVDKPGGVTSHDVVATVRRLAGEKSVGHLGTLDPMASGVLPLLLGNYTRLAQFFSHAEKTYEGEIRFGFATDTWDADGESVSEPQPTAFRDDQLQTAADGLRGVIEQVPPAFSAKKINGTPAYKLARRGQQPEMKPVRIEVSRFEIERTAADTARFSVTVSAGGYIRALAHVLGQELGCGAHLASLRRTRSGAWSIAQATTPGDLAQGSGVRGAMLPFADVLPEMPSVFVSEETAAKLRNGMPVNLPEFTAAPLVKLVVRPDMLAGIGRRQAMTLFAPHIMFPSL